LIPDCLNFTFSKNYQFVAFYTKSGLQHDNFSDEIVKICKFDCENGSINQIQNIKVQNTSDVLFSPNGKYFAVILRRNSVTNEQKIPLVQVYLTGGKLVTSFDYNSYPTLFWTEDEKVFAYSYHDGIVFLQFKPDGTFDQNKIELPNLLSVDFSSNKNVMRFAVVYNDKSIEARKMKIYQYPNLTSHLAYRPVMVGETFSIKISPSGNSAIAIGNKNQNVDSYYGDSFAYYLNVQNQQKLTIKKSGPVHNIQYSVKGDTFITMTGQVPPNVLLHFDKIGTELNLGDLSLNSSIFSPNNELLALGGFGNMTGLIKTYNSKTREFLGEGNAKYTSKWGWSPCGRLILTAVLYPKMMVGNEFSIFNHVCQKLTSFQIPELTQCEWVGVCEPKPLPKIFGPNKQVISSAYVPPHMRNSNKPNKPNKNKPDRPPGF